VDGGDSRNLEKRMKDQEPLEFYPTGIKRNGEGGKEGKGWIAQ